MKNKLLLFSSLAFVMLCFNGCTPDEVQTTQSQFKPLIIRVTIGEPIQPLGGVDPVNELYVNCNLGSDGLSSTVPNNVGQSVIEFNGTAVSNTLITCNLLYHDYSYNSDLTSVFTDCDTVKVEILFDGVIVFQETRDVGGTGEPGLSCGDASSWSVNYTL
jgi:hypothetical protein